MKKINYNSSDTEECISSFRRLSESLRSGADLFRRLSDAGEIPESLSDADRMLYDEAEFSEDAALFLEKAMEEYEDTEERVKTVLRKFIFQQHGDVTVERTKEYSEGELLFTHSLNHNEELSRLVVNELSKERKA